jgi:hypothetical protein
MLRIIATSSALLLTGCASSLQVWDAQRSPIEGVPFRAAEVYRVRGTYTRHTEHGEACTRAPFERTTSLPTGNLYFANVHAAEFAKTEFGMTFAESGALASITMNSEPTAPQTIEAVTTALSTLLPFAGVRAAGAAESTTETAEIRAGPPACDTGPEGVTYTRFQPD